MKLVADNSGALRRDRVLPLNEVMHLTGLSKSTLYKLSNEGAFPRQVQLTTRRVGWVESQVLGWIQSRIATDGAVE